ncbi:uncharacterized protein LOC126327210 [Schistocerca gregaria]|uniref:uncharacterized protein LOC126327210 n=1 Tax=Schistocerca gregaria TaxID=7010 RepID=UPI00211EABFC|nr:uncharacterized protein LOC126327210 [Schistocerca gregaria]
MTKMKEQTDIFQKYLERYVFKVPCDAIVAVMSQQVPISRKDTMNVAPYNSRALFNDLLLDEPTERISPLEPGRVEQECESTSSFIPQATAQNSEQPAATSSTHPAQDHLPQLQLSLQKAEYFNHQLLKCVQEHQAYLETLEKIWFHLNLLGGSVDATNLEDQIRHLIEESQNNYDMFNQIESRIQRYKESCSTPSK